MTDAVAKVPSWKSSQPAIENRLTRLENQVAGVKHRLANDVPGFDELHRALGYDVKDAVECFDQKDAWQESLRKPNIMQIIERFVNEVVDRLRTEISNELTGYVRQRGGGMGLLHGSDAKYHIADLITNKQAARANDVSRMSRGYPPLYDWKVTV